MRRPRRNEFEIEITDKLDKLLRTRSMLELHDLPVLRTFKRKPNVLLPERIRPRKIHLIPALEYRKVDSKPIKEIYVRSKRLTNVPVSKPTMMDKVGDVLDTKKSPEKTIPRPPSHQSPRMQAPNTPELPNKVRKKKCPNSQIVCILEFIRLFLLFTMVMLTIAFLVRHRPIRHVLLPPVSSTNAPDLARVLPVIHWKSAQDRDQVIGCLYKNQENKCKLSKNLTERDAMIVEDFQFKDLVVPRQNNEIWGLFQSQGLNKDSLELLSGDVLKLFNITSTFSRHSDVPFPLTRMPHPVDLMNRIYLKNATYKTSLLTDIAPVLYMEDDCDTLTERDTYVRKLMEYIPVDSYGKCVNNKKMPVFVNQSATGSSDFYFKESVEQTGKLVFLSRYKFFLAIEKAVCKDLMLGNVWLALFLGVVPIYFGSPTIREFLPHNGSVIFLEDYPSPKLLSDHLYDLIQNDTKYEQYLKHKTDGIINIKALEMSDSGSYQSDFLEAFDIFVCQICNTLYRGKLEEKTVVYANKSHYDCSLPVTALSLKVDYENPTVKVALKAIERGDELYRRQPTEHVVNNTLEVLLESNGTVVFDKKTNVPFSISQSGDLNATSHF